MEYTSGGPVSHSRVATRKVCGVAVYTYGKAGLRLAENRYKATVNNSNLDSRETLHVSNTTTHTPTLRWKIHSHTSANTHVSHIPYGKVRGSHPAMYRGNASKGLYPLRW